MIEYVRRAGQLARQAADWLGDLSEKAKAVSAALGTFGAIVGSATADNALGLNEVPTLVTAAATFAVTIYAIVWRVPNQGFVKADKPKTKTRSKGAA